MSTPPRGFDGQDGRPRRADPCRRLGGWPRPSPPRRADTIGWDAPVQIDPASPAPLNAISCPSTGLCLAVDGSGDLVSSSDPTGGASTWTTADIDGSGLGLNGLTGISCPSASFCAAVDLMGNVLTTTTPGTPTARWSVAAITANPLSGISCPSASCAGGGPVRQRLDLDQPVGGAARGPAPPSTAPTRSPACRAPPPRCAWPWTGAARSSAPPTRRAGPAPGRAPPSIPAARSMRCRAPRPPCASPWTTTATCSSRPLREAPSSGWTTVAVDPAAGLDSVSCATATTECIAGDDAGNVAVSGNPAGRRLDLDAPPPSRTARRWTGCLAPPPASARAPTPPVTSSPPPLRRRPGGVGLDGAGERDGRGLSGIACPAAAQCYAVDANGNLLHSTAPGIGQSGWSSASIDSGNGLTAIACPSAKLCVAVDQLGNVLHSTNPGGGASAWQSVSVDPDGTLLAVVVPVDEPVRRHRLQRQRSHLHRSHRRRVGLGHRQHRRRRRAARRLVPGDDAVRDHRRQRDRADARPTPRRARTPGRRATSRTRRWTRCPARPRPCASPWTPTARSSPPPTRSRAPGGRR